MNQPSVPLLWRLRRAAAEMRILDVYLRTGISMSRYRLIERGKRIPTELEVRLIEQALPPLPLSALNRKAGADQELLAVDD